jgi:hypothetical protein
MVAVSAKMVHRRIKFLLEFYLSCLSHGAGSIPDGVIGIFQ